jgi:hypothetical protein
MESLRQSQGWSMMDVANLLSWPVIPRDREGWLSTTAKELNFGPVIKG